MSELSTSAPSSTEASGPNMARPEASRFLTRRRMLEVVGLAAITVVGVACGPTATPSPTAAPAKPAAQPTTAPAQPTAAPAKPTEAPKPAAQATKPAIQPTAAATKPAAGPIEMYWFLPLSAAPEIKIWEEFVDRFQKANPGITIKGSYEPWANYWTKLQTVMAGGAVPDVIWLHSTRTAEWASKDVIKPFDDLLAADKIDPGEFVYIEAFRYKGKLYSLPKDNGVQALWFNVDAYSKAGAKLPTKDSTWDQLLDAAKLLTVDQSGKHAADSGFNPQRIAQWGVNFLPTSPREAPFYTAFTSLGGKLYDAEWKSSLVAEPDSVEALQSIADLRVRWKVAPLPGAITEPGDPFRIGKVANTWGHLSTAFFLHEEKRSFKWDTTFIPRGKGGLVITGGATGFSIPKATKHPEEAWVLTKFMTGEEQQKLIVSQRRWGAGRTKQVPLEYVEGYHSQGFVATHVDPLIGKGPQVRPTPAPPALAEIEQVWNSAFDPVWLGKTQAKAVVADLKKEIDKLLQRPTKI